jgi:hypothetical protein
VASDVTAHVSKCCHEEWELQILGATFESAQRVKLLSSSSVQSKSDII